MHNIGMYYKRINAITICKLIQKKHVMKAAEEHTQQKDTLILEIIAKDMYLQVCYSYRYFIS